MMNKWNGLCDSTPISLIRWDSSWPVLADGVERKKLLSYLEDRFGISQTAFDPYLFFAKKKGWWVLRKTSNVAKVSRIAVCQVGMRALQQVGQFIKPTTRFVQLFGHLATKNVVTLDALSLQRIVKGEPMTVDRRIEKGYIILCYKDSALGVGLLIDGSLLAQLPKKETLFLHKWRPMGFTPSDTRS